jgi:Phosphopantothenoylcysteine synthetase/decarboxylase
MHTFSDIQKRKKRILLGITGSVAAIKGPDLALKLSKELGDAHVAILLSQGGENFWYKAKEYDPQTWQEYCDKTAFHDCSHADNDQMQPLIPTLPQKDHIGSIILFRKCMVS